ncbi:MAG TPA: hypothetical protein PKD51_11515 [Saprospiraceae bacterium]|nr:hypothetical protein [Saprospiraceae bacterium]
MITVKKEISHFCDNVVHTTGPEIIVDNIADEIDAEALIQFKKYNSVCFNKYMYYQKSQEL